MEIARVDEKGLWPYFKIPSHDDKTLCRFSSNQVVDYSSRRVEFSLIVIYLSIFLGFLGIPILPT